MTVPPSPAPPGMPPPGRPGMPPPPGARGLAPPSPPPPPPGPAGPPPGSLPPEGYVPVGWTGVPQPVRVDGLAIASLLCGLGGLLCFVTPILGIVFGLVSRSRIRRSDGELTGGGMALAGTVVSALLLAVVATFFVLGRILS